MREIISSSSQERRSGLALTMRSPAALLPLVMCVAQASAQSKPELAGINLQLGHSRILQGLAQTDRRWANVLVGPVYPGQTMASGGCALTAISMVANYFGLIPKINVPVPNWSPLETSPVSINETLLNHDGYTLIGFCDICIDWENGLANAFWDPSFSSVGFRIIATGAWPAGEKAVDRKLAARVPSFLMMRLTPGQPNLTHLVVVAGWDEPTQSYLILDPYMQTGSIAKPAESFYGKDWRQKVAQARSRCGPKGTPS
jgi:hypothetical protein